MCCCSFLENALDRYRVNRRLMACESSYQPVASFITLPKSVSYQPKQCRTSSSCFYHPNNVPGIKAPSSSWLCVRWRGRSCLAAHTALSTSFSSAHAFLLFHCFRTFKYYKDFHMFSTSSSLFLLFSVLLTVPCFSSDIAGCLSSLSSLPLQFFSFNYHAVLFLLPNSYLYWYFSDLFSTTDSTLKCCLQLLFPS